MCVQSCWAACGAVCEPLQQQVEGTITLPAPSCVTHLAGTATSCRAHQCHAQAALPLVAAVVMVVVAAVVAVMVAAMGVAGRLTTSQLKD